MVRRGKSRLNAVIGKVELVQKDLSGNPTNRDLNQIVINSGR
jgi:hypothetical protein